MIPGMLRLLPGGWSPGAACAHAYVTHERDVAVFSGITGADPATGTFAGDGLVAEVARAAGNVAALVDCAGITGQPLFHLRVHVRDRHGYASHIEAVTVVLRRALGGLDPVVTVVVSPRLLDSRTSVELDGVVAAS